MKISNESRVGIFTAITITILILGYNYMKGRDLFTKTNTYYAVFQNVDRLVTSNPVMINGYRIGQVTMVKMIPSDSMKLLVAIEVESSLNVPRDSYIKIFSSDFFGSKAIELVMGESPVYANDKDTLLPKLEPGFVENLNKITTPLRERVESILISIDSTFKGPAGEQLRLAMQKLPGTMDNLNNTVRSMNHIIEVRLNNIMKDAESISKNIADNQDEFTHLMSNLSSFSDTLQAMKLGQTLTRANALLAEMQITFDNINNGKGTLGQLAQNEQLYIELKNTAHNLDELVKDLKARPNRYLNFSVFGNRESEKKKKDQ